MSPQAPSNDPIINALQNDPSIGADGVIKSKAIAKVVQLAVQKEHALLLSTWNHKAEALSKAGKSGSCAFESILLILAQERHLNAINLKETALRKGEYEEKAAVIYCLELSQLVMTPEEKKGFVW
jgi:hypothetical protein